MFHVSPRGHCSESFATWRLRTLALLNNGTILSCARTLSRSFALALYTSITGLYAAVYIVLSVGVSVCPCLSLCVCHGLCVAVYTGITGPYAAVYIAGLEPRVDLQRNHMSYKERRERNGGKEKSSGVYRGGTTNARRRGQGEEE